MAPFWITGAVAVAVVAGWLASLLIGFAQHDYTSLTITTPVMLLLAGYAFGVQIIKGKRNGNGNGRKDDRWSHMP